MAQYLVTYDIQRASSDPHAKIKEHAGHYGWFEFATDYEGKFSYLPNTTLFGYFDDLLSAQAKFYELVEKARNSSANGLILEKHFITEASIYIFASDKTYG